MTIALPLCIVALAKEYQFNRKKSIEARYSEKGKGIKCNIFIFLYITQLQGLLPLSSEPVA